MTIDDDIEDDDAGCACRSPYTGDAAAGHAADAGQRPAAVLFRLLHLRHHRSPAVGRTSPQSLLPRPAAECLRRRVSFIR